MNNVDDVNHPLIDDCSDARILIRDEGVYWSSGFVKGFIMFKMKNGSLYPFDLTNTLGIVKTVLCFWNDDEEDFTDDCIVVVDKRSRGR